MEESLFGHLVTHFSSSPENLATEAFCFLLNRSQVAREAFRSLLNHFHIALPANVKYETQDSGSDGAIPDLVGRDSEGKSVLYGESKFWAGLTDHQPVTYLKRLCESDGKALIFLAPAIRFPTLWPELLRRCNNAGLQTAEVESDIAEIKFWKIQDNYALLLMSWQVVLNAMHQALEAEGDREMISNLMQFQGLCAKMDQTAFLPVRSEELTSNIGGRIIQYLDIVDEVTEQLISKGLAVKKGYHAASSRGIYVQYVRAKGNAYALSFSPVLWTKYAATPLWLGITKTVAPGQWGYDAEAREKLKCLEMETPPRLFKEEKDYYLYVPLFVETGVERSEVIRVIIQQIKEIFDLLNPDVE